MFKRSVVVLGLALAPILTLSGQTNAADEDPAHDELRALMKEFMEVYNSGDLDKMITYLDDKVVITWQNAHVDTSPQEVKAYFELMTKGPNRRVKKSTIAPQPEGLSLLHNDNHTAIAYGHSDDHYWLTDGTEFEQSTRWSATVVKTDGRWKLACLHISTNMFDNPVLNLAVQKTALWAGGICGLAGMIVALVISGLVCRRKMARSSA